MKKILMIFVLFVFPFIVSAQAIPQLQVGKLSTDKYTYQAGEIVKGSFIIHNIGDVSANEIYYRIGYGEYGSSGGELRHEFDTVESVEPITVEAGESREIQFSILPTSVSIERQGIDVVLTHKNGVPLGWKKIPITVQGSLKSLDVINGVLVINGYEYPLASGPTVSSDSSAELGVALRDSVFSGTKKGKFFVYDRSDVGVLVSEKEVDVSFEDGIGFVGLPISDLKPSSYSVIFSLVDESGSEISTILKSRFVVEGQQAEILNIQANKSKLKKDENYTISMSYSGTPVNINFDKELLSTSTSNIGVRLMIVNEKNEVVSNYDGKINGQTFEQEKSPEEMTTEEMQEYVDSQTQNTFSADIDLKSINSSKDLYIQAELYDIETGEVYDTYQTVLEKSSFDYTLILYVVSLIVLVGIIIILLSTRHRIPTVCFILILLSLLGADIIVKNAEARVAYTLGGSYGSGGSLVIGSPISSLVGGYNPGESISLDVTYAVFACANNGQLNLKLYAPKDSTWHGFGSGSVAVNHMKANMPTKTLTWKCSNAQSGRGGVRRVCVPSYEKNESAYYKEIIRTTNTWIDSGSYWGNTYVSIDDELTAPSTPGYHYIPFASQYCTQSHGCGSAQFMAWEICVKGAGVCPDEDSIDYCPNIDLDGDDIGVPEGYKLDQGGNCVPDNINICQPDPDPSNLGQVCGCNNVGTIQCDGSCKTGVGIDIPASCNTSFSVSCAASPSSVEPGKSTSISANISNATGTVSYIWTRPDGSTSNSTSLSYSNSTIGSYQFNIQVQDSEGNNASNNCRVTVSEQGCDNTHSGETVCINGQEYSWICTGSNWNQAPTGNACVAGDPVVDIWKFDPRIVSSGDTCKLTLDAQNVSSCSIYDKTGSIAQTIPAGVLNTISTQGVYEFTAGIYELKCTSVDGSIEESFGTDKCISNLDVKEN